MIEVDFQGTLFQGTITLSLSVVPRAGERVTIITDGGLGSIAGTVAGVEWTLDTNQQRAAVQLTP